MAVAASPGRCLCQSFRINGKTLTDPAPPRQAQSACSSQLGRSMTSHLRWVGSCHALPILRSNRIRSSTRLLSCHRRVTTCKRRRPGVSSWRPTPMAMGHSLMMTVCKGAGAHAWRADRGAPQGDKVQAQERDNFAPPEGRRLPHYHPRHVLFRLDRRQNAVAMFIIVDQQVSNHAGQRRWHAPHQVGLGRCITAVDP